MYKYDIKKRRHELGFTLEQVGQAVGVGKSTVRKWETGHIENMKRDKIALLAEVLQISPVEFMGWADAQSTRKPLTKDEEQLLEVYKRAKESDKVSVKALLSAIDKLLEADE